MRFEDFARAHGLIINSVIPDRWVSTPTEDHPRKRNGRYKFLGDIGWVQNWATMTKPEVWRSVTTVTPQDRRDMFQRMARERQRETQAAASKAGWIMNQTIRASHPYLVKKGFPDEVGNVWNADTDSLLVIPMRGLDKRIVGCQLIDSEGKKKFLQGQASKGAVFAMNAGGLPIFCEGYATGLSIRAVMVQIKIRYSIYVCFSAANVEEVASRFTTGIVVADNDANQVGEETARRTGKPYWIAPTVGQDFNDFHQSVGIFKASQALKKLLIQSGAASSV